MHFTFSNLHAFVLLSVFTFGSLADVEAQITSIQSLEEVQVSHPDNTLFLLDLDDTIFDFPYMLGSKSWRSYIKQATKEIDQSRNWHDILSLHLTKHYPIKTVEPITSEFVKNLQDKGFIVNGFTSRERKLWYDTSQEGVDILTVGQLNSVGVNFNNKSLESTYPYLALEPEYFEGTFFCNIEPKGNFLTHLFKDAPEIPPKVVFIDDKLSQAESVANALNGLKIPYESYYYLATNAKAKEFNPLIANIQLYRFLMSNEVISDDEAALIAQENSSCDADFYLRAALGIAEIKLKELDMNTTTTIYIVKGGETAQTGQAWHGSETVSSLTAQGEESAGALQSRVITWGVTVAYTSPQQRMIDSAEIALKDSGIKATVNQDLRPRKITPFEGMPGEQVKALYKQHNGLDPLLKVTSDSVFSKEWGPWESDAFEINEKLRGRIKHFVDDVVEAHPGQKVFVQTHIDWIREAYRLFAEAPDTEDYSVTTQSVLTLTFNSDKQLIGVRREGMPNR